MEKCRYRISPRAEADLDRYARHIARDNHEAGLRLYDLARETYEMLCEIPPMGVNYHPAKQQLAGIRYVPVREYSRYLVFYKFTAQAVDIIRLLHARMDKDGWL